MKFQKPKKIVFVGNASSLIKFFAQGNETELVSSISFLNTIAVRFKPDLIVFETLSSADIAEIRKNALLKEAVILIAEENFNQYNNLSTVASFSRIIMCNTCIVKKEKFILHLNAVVSEKKKFANPKTSSIVKYAVLFMNRNVSKKISRSDFSRQLGINESYLSRIFRSEMGVTLWEYLNAFRLDEAKKTLENSSLSIKEISRQYGFESDSYFIKAFKKEFGISPDASRRV